MFGDIVSWDEARCRNFLEAERLLLHVPYSDIIAKLRRGESFTFSWEYSTDSGSGHSSIWLHPAIPLQFEFRGSRDPSLNRLWLEELVRLSNTPAGLRIVPEPVETVINS